MDKGEDNKRFRKDRIAKVSFSLVAVIILMLSTASVIYMAYIDRVDRERKQNEAITSDMEYQTSIAHAEVESEAYIMAMDAIYEATQIEDDQNRIIPIFNKNFEDYIAKYTQENGVDIGDYTVRIINYSVDISVNSELTTDFAPVDLGGVSQGSAIDSVKVDNPEEAIDLPTRCYYSLIGEMKYEIEHDDSDKELE